MEHAYSNHITDATREYAEVFLKRLAHKTTRKNYLNTLNSFAEYCKKDLLLISMDDCSAFLNHMRDEIIRKNYKEGTLSKYRKQLSSFYNFLIKNQEYLDAPKGINNYFKELPIDFADAPQIALSRIPKVQELDLLFAYTRKANVQCCIAFLLAFKGYLTMEQIRCLKASNFFYDKENHLCVKVTKVHAKTKRTEERYNLITSDLEEIIVSYLDQLIEQYPYVSDPYLFSKDQKSCVTQKTIRNWLTNALKRLHLPAYTMNDLRNAGAVYALTYHADLKEVADSMGYQSYRHIAKLKNTEITLNKAAEHIGIQFTPPNPSNE